MNKNMNYGKAIIKTEKGGRLNITKGWEQAQVKSSKNILRIKKQWILF